MHIYVCMHACGRYKISEVRMKYKKFGNNSLANVLVNGPTVVVLEGRK